jgi:molecular chaperone DnaJ
VVFEVEADARYEREGFDLHQRVEVPWPVFVLGGSLPVETLYGGDQIKIAPGTPADKIVKLANAGVPRLRGGGRGDLYLHLRVEVPTQLTSEQEDLIRQLRATFEAPGEAEGEGGGFLAKVFGGSEKSGKKKKRK